VHTQSEAGRYTVLRACSEEALRMMRQLDVDGWENIVSLYCEWAKLDGFDFVYCDVLGSRLLEIYKLGEIHIKAEAALAAARLATSHNRYYVMRRVLEMCSPAIPDSLAQRIAIEIRATDAADDFERCLIEAPDGNILAYHPRIAAAMLPQAAHECS
jgi:eukaryotic-like serine/threonine-protein kinase